MGVVQVGLGFTQAPLRGLAKWRSLASAVAEQSTLVYGGEESLELQDTRIVSWKHLRGLTEQV